MRLHPDLEKYLIKEDKPEVIDAIFKRAEKVGLNQLNYTAFYEMYKSARKDKTKVTFIPEGFRNKGVISLIGGIDKEQGNWVALYLDGLRDWNKTSPIINVKKTDKGFEVETENSFYTLE